jgi:subtilisin family serine protease
VRRLLTATVTLALLLSPAAATASEDQPATPGPSPALSAHDVIVQWAPEADRGDRLAAREGAEVSFRSDLGSREFQLVSTEPGQSPGDAVRELEADPAVAVAERDGYRSLDALPNDPLLGQLWGLANFGIGINGFVGAVAGDDIDAAGAWLRTVGTPSTVVADIDSGYRFDDGDLGPVAWTNGGEVPGNGFDDDGNGFTDDVHGWDFVGPSAEAPTSDNDPTDDNLISGGHGLHTAGTIGAAGNNGIGITGVAQDVRIMPLRVCANSATINEVRCPFSSIIAAINYAGDNHARVANMSLGGNTFTQTEVNAIAAHPQTLYVISAGNDGGNNDGGEAAPKGHHYPCDYQPTTQASPAVPGAVDNIVCVAATDQADGLASFSDWGVFSVDLGAPGSSVLSTYPAQETPVSDSFEVNDFASKWTSSGAGFGRAGVGDGPLTSFGITDSPGATPAPGSIHEVRLTTATPMPLGAGACRISGKRFRRGGSFSYGLLIDGAPKEFTSGETAGSSMASFNTVPITGLGGHAVQLFFRYTASGSPAAGDGIWLDDLNLGCYSPLAAPLSYAFLDGTSMAAPHVTGTAALLFSEKPTATVTEVKAALLNSVDFAPSLKGKTVTAGRLNASQAVDVFDQTPPAAPLLFGTSPPSPAPSSTPRITGSAEERATITVFASAGCAGTPAAGGSAAELAAGGIQVSVGAGTTGQFSATATDTAGNHSACSAPISYTNSSGGGGQGEGGPSGGGGGSSGSGSPAGGGSGSGGSGDGPAAPTCKVPKLAGKTLAQARSALVAAHCQAGKVTKPAAKKGRPQPALIVVSSSPAAGATPANGVVALRLGPKPIKHHH